MTNPVYQTQEPATPPKGLVVETREGTNGGAVQAVYFDGSNIIPDYYLEVARGNVAGVSLVEKFGASTIVGTTVAPVAIAGLYRTPTAATNLEFISRPLPVAHG